MKRKDRTMNMKIINDTIEQQLAKLVPVRGHMIAKIYTMKKEAFEYCEQLIDILLNKKYSNKQILTQAKIHMFQMVALKRLEEYGDMLAKKMALTLVDRKNRLNYGLMLQDKKSHIRVGVFCSAKKYQRCNVSVNIE